MSTDKSMFEDSSSSSDEDDAAPVTAAAPSSSTQAALFEDDSSDDSDDDDDAVRKSHPVSSPLSRRPIVGNDSDSSDSDDDAADDDSRPKVRYEDKDITVPEAPRPQDEAKDPDTFEMLIAHLPATVDIIPEPFAADQYDEAAEDAKLKERQKEFAKNSLIRWRVDDQTGQIQSNTRIVEYSDGSRVLFVGKQPFLAPTPNATKHSYVGLSRKAQHPDGTSYVFIAPIVAFNLQSPTVLCALLSAFRVIFQVFGI